MLRHKGHQPEQVFADCKNESERQVALAKIVEPHGFCVACMLHCHEGHDVHELYSKLDFRCDCGNSKMPLSCQIDGSYVPIATAATSGAGSKSKGGTAAHVATASEIPITETDAGKDHVNRDNLYNMTFFDIYCICKQPH